MLCPSVFIATVVIQISPHDSHVLTFALLRPRKLVSGILPVRSVQKNAATRSHFNTVALFEPRDLN